jgi:hypothetical protein
LKTSFHCNVREIQEGIQMEVHGQSSTKRIALYH